MSTALNFDFSQISPEWSGGQFLPVSDDRGWLVILTGDNGFKPANSGEGYYLELAGKGQEGPVANMDFVLRLNLQHVKPAAVAAASAQLSALGHVCGLPGRVNTTDELFNKPFRIVSVKQSNSDYTQLANNGIRDVNGNLPGKSGQGPQVAQPAPVQPPPQAPQAPQAPQGQWQTGPALGAPPQGAPQGFAPPQGQGGFVSQGQPPQGAPQTFAAPPQGGNAAPFGAPTGQPSWATGPGR